MKRIVLALMFTVPYCVFAQSTSHLKASEQFVEVSGSKESFGDVINTMLEAQASRFPEENREKLKAVMKAFFGKYYTYEILKPKLAKIYADEFTEAELKELITFYSSSTGKKFANKLGALTQK